VLSTGSKLLFSFFQAAHTIKLFVLPWVSESWKTLLYQATSIRPTKKHQFPTPTCSQAFQCKPCVGHVPCRAARLVDTGHMCSNVKSIGSSAGSQGLTNRQHGNEVPSDVTWRQRVCRNVKRPGHVTVAERKQPSQPATQNNRGQKLRKLSFELLTCQQLLEPDRA
jgi:hypothetical protein